MKLVPVDHDPFADAAAAPAGGPRLVPVDHDPFAPTDAAAQAGPLPALEDAGAGAAVARGLINGIPIAGPYILAGANRAAAGIRSLANDTKFSDELKRVEEVSDRTAKQHPITTGVSEVAGGIAGTLPMVAAAPAAFGAGAAGIGARSLASMASGAVLGGADAAVRNDADIRETRNGAIAGGALGAIAPAAGALVGAGVRKVAEMVGTRAAPSAGMGSGAMGKLAADAENAGGPAAVRARMDELGPEAMLLDASPSFEGRAQGLAILPDTRETVMAPLTARAKTANARLGDDVERTLGPATDPAAFHAATDADYAQAVPPLYRQAFAQPVTVDTSGVLSTIGRIGEQEKGGASQALERAWRLLHTEADLPGIGRAMVPDRRPEALHNAKEALDAMIAQVQAQQGSAAASELRALAMVRSGVNEALEAQVPGYAEANRTAQRFFQQRDAFDQGQTLLNGGREAVRPDQLAAERAAMAPEVQDAQRLGLRAEVDRLVGTRLNDRLALRQALMGEGDYNRARMGTVFGEEPTAGLAAAVDREAAFDAAHQRINNNAMTAMRLRAADDVAPREVRSGSGDIGTVVAGAAGGVKGVAAAYGIKGAKMAADAAGRARDVARNKELADAVTMRRGDDLNRLLAAIEARTAAEAGAAGIGRAAGLATQSGLVSQSDRMQPYMPFGFLPR